MLTDEYEDIPIESIRKELRMSRQEFLDLLNDDSSENRLITSMEADFREYMDKLEIRGRSNISFFTIHHLTSITVEHLDFEKWKNQKYEFDENNKWKKASNTIEDGFYFLHNMFIEQSSRIKELSKKVQEKDQYINSLMLKIKQLESNSNTTLVSGAVHCDGCGELLTICKMRRERKSEEEIAKYLSDDGNWHSSAQIGALLHLGGRVAPASMVMRGRRLLGKVRE